MDPSGDLLNNVTLGLATALAPINLLYCFIGVFLGTLVGVLPGIGALSAIALLLPITFHLDATSALVMLAGVFYGSSYGGSTASILLNLPGTPSSAVTCLDGYPMSRQGRGGAALLMVTVASFIGGSIGILILMLFAPVIANLALNFGAEEYFSMMLLGLMAASAISSGAPVKGIVMVVFGVLVGTVGTDVGSGVQRFVFGIPQLFDGISLLAIAMGLFGVAEVISSVRVIRSGHVDRKGITFRSMVPTRDELRRSWLPILRGTAIGSFFGALPGTGGVASAFMSYVVEKKIARDPSRFGKGAIEGVVAPEAANNACDQTAFIPTLTLGIPGSVTMALMIGALMIQGITPGPQFMIDKPDVFWGLVMSFWIGNVLLVILNIPLIGIWVRVLAVPYHMLYPAILVFVCLGVYSVQNSYFDVATTVLFGALGYLMRLLEFEPAPMLLGVVLGPLMEENLRRALMISRGDFMVFLEKPISAAFMAVSLALLAWSLWRTLARPARPAVEDA